MLVNLLATNSGCRPGDSPWIVDAWDEYSIEENEQGFAGAISKAEAKYGAGSIRVIQVQVPDDTLVKAFEYIKVEGSVVNE